jgi:hypothetical protein
MPAGLPAPKSDEEVAVPHVTGVERAVFGDVGADEIRAWPGRHLRSC